MAPKQPTQSTAARPPSILERDKLHGIWLEPLPQTLTGILLSKAEMAPDRVAVTMMGEDITYEKLVNKSASVARGLIHLGVTRGDVLAVFAENSTTHLYAEFAAARIGAIEVMINTAFKGDFLAHQLRDSGAKMVIVAHGLLDTVLAILPLVPAITSIIVIAADQSYDDVSAGVPILGIEALMDHSSSSLSDMRDPLSTDPCSIVYTSGTTGPSKGVLLSNNYLCLFAEIHSSLWYSGPQDVFYSVGPLYHLGAKGVGVLGSIYRGVRCVQDERFSASNFWSRVRNEGCNATMMLGSVAMLLWGREPSAEEGIDTIYVNPVPVKLLGPMEKRWSCKFESAYGLSEAAPITHTGPTVPLRPGSAGKVDERYFDVRIFDDEDRELLVGSVGEVVVRPKRPNSIFEGYYRNPEATLGQMRNCWFHTGDLGRFDADGYFYFVDRKKDYLRRRGENISSFEVEVAIASHPLVVEAAIVAVSSELGEDEVKAFVMLRAGTSLSNEELIAHCIEKMPYFSVPRYVEFVDDLPRTPSGKVEKHKLRAQGRGSAWDREEAGGVLSGKRQERHREAGAVPMP